MIFEPSVDLVKVYNNNNKKSPRAFITLKDAVECITKQNEYIQSLEARIKALEDA